MTDQNLESARELRFLHTVHHRRCVECLPIRRTATRELVENGKVVGSACEQHATLWKRGLDRLSRGIR